VREKVIYFPGLNGLRALAALAVVISHVTLSLTNFGLDPYIFGSLPDGKPKGLTLAGYGVSIFFVLSGFLITYLLLAERAVKEISIKKFYLRRILRIWPLYYLYLVITIFFFQLSGQAIDVPTLLLYIFYGANIPFIVGTALPFLSHYWSLGVEEQFYLFWPWVIKKGIRRIMPLIIGAIVVLVGTRLVLHFFYSNTIIERALQVTRFHCMLLGALGAVLYKQQHVLFLRVTNNKVTQVFCWIILGVVLMNKFHVASVIDDDIISAVALCLVIGQISVKNRIINLELRVFDFLGKISYGIYVIHPLLLYVLQKPLRQIPLEGMMKYFVVYLIVILCTVLLAWVSYTYFEKYFLRLKGRFAVVPSSASSSISK
jgi:peptidoglycan/LPS O-acetylase OafA/YrhL